MRCALMIAVFVGTLCPSSASAQAAKGTFQELRDAGKLELGDSFVVRRPDGTRVTGELQAMSPTTMRLRVGGNVLELSEAEVDRIERRDPVDSGAWLGALAGAGAASAWSAIRCGNDSECRGYVTLYTIGPLSLGGGVAGLLVDRAMRKVVFDAKAAHAPSLLLSPVVSRQLRGAVLSVAW